MSNDLISRRSLLKALNKWDISKLHLVDSFKELVDGQPTAYDIDEKVEQLEEKKILCGEIATEAIEMNDMQLYVGARNQVVAFAEAIEIVRGGINE